MRTRGFLVRPALHLALACAVLQAAALNEVHAQRRPTPSVRATPPIAMAPAKIGFVVEVKGGADDDRDFYCPTLNWEWGDGSTSERSSDCDPYEEGKSRIQRRYFIEREYKEDGIFKVEVRFKRGNRVIAMAWTAVEIRSGRPVHETTGGHPLPLR